MVAKWLEERFPKTKFDFINAGYIVHLLDYRAFVCKETPFPMAPSICSSSSSRLMTIRMPDIPRRHYIRVWMEEYPKMRLQSPKTDLVVTYFVNPGMLEKLKKEKTPLPMAAHERVLQKYGVSEVHSASRNSPGKSSKLLFFWENSAEPTPKNRETAFAQADMHIEMLGKAWSVKERRGPQQEKVPPRAH